MIFHFLFYELKRNRDDARLGTLSRSLPLHKATQMLHYYRLYNKLPRLIWNIDAVPLSALPLP